MLIAHAYVLSWNLAPSILVGCVGLLVGLLAIQGWRPNRQTVWFGLGIVALLIALVSPLDTLADDYLFSAHMIQHLLLILVVPPLLLVGIPADWLKRVLGYGPIRLFERILSQPVLAWLLAIGMLWAWHWPALYEAALRDEFVHIEEHLLLLITATIFWWPVIAQPEPRRMAAVPAMIYLFSAAIASSSLGIFLAFAPSGIYPFYLNPPDSAGLLPLLRNDWGLTPALDQQVGGILMWVLGGPGYLCGLIVVFARWYNTVYNNTEEVFG